jgi:23S rRNA (adenine2503-C2)-methyltransferase
LIELINSREGKILTALDEGELETVLAPLPSFRARQIFKWIYRGAGSFDEMTDLPVSLREELKQRFTLYGSAIKTTLADRDGTVKLLAEFPDGARAEAVLLKDRKGRFTACLSVQAGCPVGCVFCKTGALGFLRNLEAHEITEQFLHLSREAAPPIENIVVMGMGEPLLNLGPLRKALGLITGGKGLSLRRVTVSTSGIPRGILDMAENGPKTELAFSLTTAREDLRQRLMPGIREFSLAETKAALAVYQEKTGRRITLETVLLGGINSGPEDAGALMDFARGLFAVVNVIPWNPVEGLCFEGKPLREPSPAELEGFIRRLESGGLKVTRRYRRGRGVSGACGQLGGTPSPLKQRGNQNLKNPDKGAEDGAEKVYPF